MKNVHNRYNEVVCVCCVGCSEAFLRSSNQKRYWTSTDQQFSRAKF